ncbi:MAG: CPBP family intramembrane metalloprotease [Anaerolineae bacterium]|nr:CPBP family intramembrane metalloprotease [Anaerolineae bacterium]
MAKETRGTFFSERVWPVVRALVLQLLLMMGIIGGLVAILVFTVLVDQLQWLHIDFHGQTMETISPEGKIWGLSIIFAVNLLLTIGAWRLLERKRLSGMLWKFSRDQWRPLLWGLLAGLGEVLLVFGGMLLFGVVHPRWGLSAVSPKTVAMALGWVFASSVIGPIAEEVLNRGYWFQNIKRGWGIVTATVVTSLLFGGLHLLNPNAEILGAVNIALSAAVWVLGMLWLRSLWFPIGWHAAWNFAQFFVVGLPNSGISVSSMGLEGSTLLVSELSGSHWLTGGDFGMEASLFKTIILIMVLVGTLWLKKTMVAKSAREQFLESRQI